MGNVSLTRVRSRPHPGVASVAWSSDSPRSADWAVERVRNGAYPPAVMRSVPVSIFQLRPVAFSGVALSPPEVLRRLLYRVRLLRRSSCSALGRFVRSSVTPRLSGGSVPPRAVLAATFKGLSLKGRDKVFQRMSRRFATRPAHGISGAASDLPVPAGPHSIPDVRHPAAELDELHNVASCPVELRQKPSDCLWKSTCPLH